MAYPEVVRVSFLEASYFLIVVLFLGVSVVCMAQHGAFGDEGSNGATGRDLRQLVLDASVRLHGVGISVINSCPRELLYLTVSEISLSYLREGQVCELLRHWRSPACTPAFAPWLGVWYHREQALRGGCRDLTSRGFRKSTDARNDWRLHRTRCSE